MHLIFASRNYMQWLGSGIAALRAGRHLLW